MSDESEMLSEMLKEAVDESVQDVYNVYRPTIGDYKMDAHRWEWRRDRHAAFSAWLKALAARVDARMEEEQR